MESRQPMIVIGAVSLTIDMAREESFGFDKVK